MSAGVSGATLWVPVYLLWLRVSAPFAFWLGLLTMLCGFGSGVFRNWRDGTYDGKLVRHYLAASAPAALIAAWYSGVVNQRFLVAGFGAFLFLYAAIIIMRTLRTNGLPDRRDVAAYPAAAVGGVLTGLISIGVGVVTMPWLMSHRSIKRPSEGIGSLVMIVFFTSIAAAIGRLRPEFVAALRHGAMHLVSMLIWAGPGAAIGGQIGPRVARRLPSERHARLYFSVVLIVIGALTLVRAMGPEALALMY